MKETKEILKELNIKRTSLKRYLKYLGIEYEVKNYPAKGISEEDFERLKEFCEKNSALERKRVLTEHTSLKRNGTLHPSQSNKSKKKREETCLKKYGVSNVSKTEEVKTKKEVSSLLKFGQSTPLQSDEVKKKIRKTNLERYGVENISQLESVKEKKKQKNLEKYGVENYAQTLEFHRSHISKYRFNNLSFDSSWELAFFIYHKDMGADIEREPCSIEYEFEEKIHRYFPDFRLNGKLVEIKGGHLLNAMRGGFIFSNRDSGLQKAKYKCLQENNVEIVTKDDLKEVFEYIKNTYGKNFLSQFKLL